MREDIPTHVVMRWSRDLEDGDEAEVDIFIIQGKFFFFF